MWQGTMYNLMRQSERMDDDGKDIDEALHTDNSTDAQKFKQQYKQFYTDIKTDIKEDW